MLVQRLLVLVAALALLFGVVAAAERTRRTVTPLGQALGVASGDARLAAVADAQSLRGTPPSAGDRALARRMAGSAPLSPYPFYVLGTNGQVRDPRAAVAAALHRDPRFRPGYDWLAEFDAKAGDVAGATRALIRLAMISPRNQRIFPALIQLTADPAARAVLKDEIAHGATWRDAYLSALGASTVDRVVVFEMLQTAGKSTGASGDAPMPSAQPGQPDDRRAFLAAMVARKDYERAYLAWVQWLPAASQRAVGRVFDGGFTNAVGLSPFAWELSNGVGGAAVIDPATGLTLDYSGTQGATLAQQMVLLEPGRYRIATQARFDEAAAAAGAPPLVWSLTCLSDSRVLSELALPLAGAPKRADGAAFAVPAECPAQTLALRVNPADFAQRLSGQIRNVAIETIR